MLLCLWQQLKIYKVLISATSFPGDTVFVHSAAATPTPLLGALADHGKKSSLKNVTVCHIHIEGKAAHLDPECEGK